MYYIVTATFLVGTVVLLFATCTARDGFEDRQGFHDARGPAGGDQEEHPKRI